MSLEQIGLRPVHLVLSDIVDENVSIFVTDRCVTSPVTNMLTALDSLTFEAQRAKNKIFLLRQHYIAHHAIRQPQQHPNCFSFVNYFAFLLIFFCKNWLLYCSSRPVVHSKRLPATNDKWTVRFIANVFIMVWRRHFDSFVLISPSKDELGFYSARQKNADTSDWRTDTLSNDTMLHARFHFL